MFFKRKNGTHVAPDPPQFLDEEHVTPHEKGFAQEMQLIHSSEKGSEFGFKTVSSGRTSETVDYAFAGLGEPLGVSYNKRKPRG
jgi:hypothetical protein